MLQTNELAVAVTFASRPRSVMNAIPAGPKAKTRFSALKPEGPRRRPLAGELLFVIDQTTRRVDRAMDDVPSPMSWASAVEFELRKYFVPPADGSPAPP
ncbi:MAG TPA: hypothetical protein VKR30_06905 [Candidatus Limnocylindrales bacterium]|nr:hypothetical protein [Candidatus Limnocylindrales bacterium]